MTNFRTMLVSWAAALTLALFAATPASAQLQGEAELTALIAKNAAYQTMMIEAEEIFLDTLTHMDAAFEKSLTPLSKAEAQTWSSAWETKSRARLAALKQQLAAAPRVTVDEAKRVFGPEDTTGLSEVMAETPKRIQAAIDGAERTLNQTATLAPLVATGDEVALDKLAKEQFAASLYMVEIENQLLRTGIATAKPGHPQRSLAQAILASNLATMEMQRASLRNYNGEPIAGKAAAERARVHIVEGTAAAKRIPGEAKAMVDMISRGAPPEAKALIGKMRTAFATFSESAQVELDILKAMDDALSALAREDMEKLFENADKSTSLIDRRVALQSERTKILSQ